MSTDLQVVAERIAGNVRAEVARRRVTQEQLADVLRLTQQGVSRRMTGQVAFDATELALLGQALGVEPGVFFDVHDTEGGESA